MDYCGDKSCSWHTRVPIDMMAVLHWNYRGFKEFPEEIMKSRSEIITDVYLKENSITEFPRDLWQFKNLKNLYLSGNDIKVLPKEIGMLVSLKSLDLSGNLLTCVPEEISQLDHLKCLILDDNAIAHLPLSLNKLRKLRYLSICDNQLTWLPQRPVSNYYAAEFRFWRNRTLQHIPFSLWLHMLRDQQVRLQNIGCFGYPYTYKQDMKNRIQVANNFVIPDTEIVLPEQFDDIQKYPILTPPTLYELSLRQCYTLVSNVAADILNNNLGPIEPHRLEKMAEDVLKMREVDDNNNSVTNVFGEVLPACLKDELANGPTAVCEFYICKSPLFRSTILDITSRSTTTLEGPVDILVTASFCSGRCCERWRKANRISPFKWVQI